MIKRYTGGGPLNIPFYQSVVHGTLCDHLHLTRAEAEACRTKRENHRAPVIPITRARARREGGRR
jgi:hypothetical protein